MRTESRISVTNAPVARLRSERAEPRAMLNGLAPELRVSPGRGWGSIPRPGGRSGDARQCRRARSLLVKQVDRPVIEFSVRHIGKVQVTLYELEPGLFLVVRRPQAGALVRKASVDLEITNEWSGANVLAPYLRVVPVPYSPTDTRRLVTRLNENKAAHFRWCRFEMNSEGNVVVHVNSDEQLTLPRPMFYQVLDAVKILTSQDTPDRDRKGQVQ